MNTYPRIPSDKQANLPRLIEPANALPTLFEDSTHELWQCHTEQGEMVLKVCNHESVTKSVFWQGMNGLFACNFPESLGTMVETYQFVNAHSPLVTPKLIAASANSFVLTQFLAGVDLESDSVSDTLVIQLAEHLGQLHQQQYITWGSLLDPVLERHVWSRRLASTISTLAELQGLADHDAVKSAIDQAALIRPERFVPIMPDLRWDQFRLIDTGAMAVLDFDAFVIGPCELELVLLTYLLNDQQHDVFVEHYSRFVAYPDLASCRLSYQVLLFLMNVLGATDLQRWIETSNS